MAITLKGILSGLGVDVTALNEMKVSVTTSVTPTGAALDGTDGATPPSIPGTGIRGWLRSIYDKLSGSLAVTGTFFQPTQPVSIAASIPLPVGASTSAKQPALGTAGTPSADVLTVQGSASGTPIPASVAGVATAANQASQITQETAIATSAASIDTKTPVLVSGRQPVDPSGVTSPVQEIAASLAVSATGASGAAVTLTLPAVAGQFHYVTMIEIVRYAAAALTGVATPLLVTTTDLSGTPVFDFQSAGAIGTSERQLWNPSKAIKSSAVNTATTIVCPATTGVIWRVNVWYVAAP